MKKHLDGTATWRELVELVFADMIAGKAYVATIKCGRCGWAGKLLARYIPRKVVCTRMIDKANIMVIAEDGIVLIGQTR